MRNLISVLIILTAVFFVVMTKIETRRLGYEVLQLQKKYRVAIDKNRQLRVQWAQKLRPSHVRDYAQTRLTLDFARADQIIYLAPDDFEPDGLQK